MLVGGRPVLDGAPPADVAGDGAGAGAVPLGAGSCLAGRYLRRIDRRKEEVYDRRSSER